jgi:hypothetical protein
MLSLASLYGSADPVHQGSVEYKTLIQGAQSWVAQNTVALNNPHMSLVLGGWYSRKLAVPGHC